MVETILLTSGGMQVQDDILKVLPKAPTQIKLAHIITAAAIFPTAPWRDKDKKRMLAVGFQVEDIDIAGKSETQLRRLLQNKDVIYVQGGDPFYLLQQAKASGFDRIIKKLVKAGTIYIGVSAGSYIACPQLLPAIWKKPDRARYGLAKDETAMNLVSFLVSVHYDENDRDAIKKGTAQTKYPVYILTDDQAVLVHDSNVTLVGKGQPIKL